MLNVRFVVIGRSQCSFVSQVLLGSWEKTDIYPWTISWCPFQISSQPQGKSNLLLYLICNFQLWLYFVWFSEWFLSVWYWKQHMDFNNWWHWFYGRSSADIWSPNVYGFREKNHLCVWRTSSDCNCWVTYLSHFVPCLCKQSLSLTQLSLFLIKHIFLTLFRVSEDRNPANAINNQDPVFSGLYSYHVPTNTWKMLWDDSAQGGPRIKSRVGHSMLFHPVSFHFYFFQKLFLLTAKLLADLISLIPFETRCVVSCLYLLVSAERNIWMISTH